MKRIADYLTIVVIAILLVGCSTIRKGTGLVHPDSDEMLVRHLSSETSAKELTANVRYEVSGHSFTGQLRMRRGHCIQLSAGLLGIEAFRVEFFPDHVMIMDRSSRRYVECHYADLPHRNTLALDYNMVEAIFWNRLFSPQCDTQDKVVSALIAGRRDSDGSVEISDVTWGHKFRTDADGHLTAFSKSGTGWSFDVSYDNFVGVGQGFEFPLHMIFEVELPGGTVSDLKLEMKLSGMSSAQGNWKDETLPTTRMKPVELDDIIELLEAFGL